MMALEVVRPRDLGQALAVLAEDAPGTHVLAGGTDLVPDWQGGRVPVARFVDLAAVGPRGVVEGERGIVVGALTTFAELLRAPSIRTHLPALAEAAANLGAVQTRTLATLGGNLASAVPSLDSGPPLLAYGAEVRLMAAGRERRLPLAEFFLGPRRTVLEAGEIVAEVHVPMPGDGAGAAFLKAGRRRAMSLALVNVAVFLQRGPDGEIREARIGLGAVAPTPFRAMAAEERLRGETATPARFAEAAELAASLCRPIDDLRASAAYRRALVRVLTERALSLAWDRARERGRTP